jgi:carbon monoxide dehydrogenase subunit G
MATFTTSTQIAAAPEQVFEVITDFARAGEWQTVHTGWPAGQPESAGVGDTFRQQVTMMGMPAEVAWTVKQREAPSTYELEGAGPMGAILRSLFRVESADGGSRVTVENELGGGVLAGPMGETVAKSSQSEQEKSLAKLKGLLA